MAAAEFLRDVPGLKETADYRNGTPKIPRSQVLRRRRRLPGRRLPGMAGGRDKSLGGARLLCYRPARATETRQLLLFPSHLLCREADVLRGDGRGRSL